ncbi:unnamed protein product [Spirodela intermedia]|uniref:Uncharacterized protein n=1 Tax=Spirodela intermedia TaxID=51605 RepID=A0A7I8LIP2_SPIIN|nr:unnamed protein product [Spirodela intermedia]
MPKDRTRSVSFERHLHAPYPRGSSSYQKGSSSSSQYSNEPAASDADIKEWEEARCPVCMEHPHNAVLLLCASHDKGCRPYMCDTSYRHSNCLDQFRKASTSSAPCQENKGDEKSLNLLCPLCRGGVKSTIVISAARTFMNAKVRDCSLESCKFSGTYRELRKHARMEHSAMRPSDTDPERQRDWTRMERQRDIGDLLSTIQPLFIDGREAAVIGSSEEEVGASVYMSPRFLISLYVRIPQQEDEGASQLHPRLVISFGPRSESMQVRNQRRPRPQWGEIFDGERPTDAGDDTDDPVVEEVRPSSRRRRRWMRMSDDEDLL